MAAVIRGVRYRTIRQLLSDSKRWIKGSEVRAAGKILDDVRDPEATGWCLIGAAWRIYKDDKERGLALGKIQAAMYELFPRVAANGCGVATFNDAPHRTHAHIMKVLDKAKV